MKKQNLIAISFTLPMVVIIAVAALMLPAFIGYPVSAIVAVDKLLMLTIIISPVVFGSALAASIIALLKTQAKKDAIIVAAINIILLIGLLCLHKCFLFELKLMV